MEFTYLAPLIGFLGLVLFVMSGRFLLFSTIFAVPFTATSLVNFSSGFWLTPFQYFGVLLVGRHIVRLILQKHNLSLYKCNRENFLLIIFLLAVLVSLVMPLVINGSLFINGTIGIPEKGYLYLSIDNINAFIYLLFGILFAITLSGNISSREKLDDAIKVVMVSAVFISLWGVGQFLLNIYNVEYPYYIFNNNNNVVAQGYLQEIEGTEGVVKRISSVATEPSVMAQFLGPVLLMLLLLLLSGKVLFSAWFDTASIVIIAFALMISTSSTAYLGVSLSIIILIFHTIMIRRNPLIALFLICFIFGAVYALSNIVGDMNKLADIYIVDKLSSGSGQERLLTISYAWEYFLQYPIIGIGWGGASSNDLVVNILANSGIVGLISFAAFNWVLVSKVFKVRTIFIDIDSPYTCLISRQSSIAIGSSLVMVLILQIVSGFLYSFGHYWLFVGLAMAVLRVSEVERTRLYCA